MSDDSQDSSSSSSDDSSSSSDYGFDGGAYDAGSGSDWDGGHGSHYHHRHFRHGRKRRGYLDLSTAPPWVKVLTWVGTLTLIAGFVITGLGIIGSAGGANSGGATAGPHPFPDGGITGEAFPGGITENERLITIDGHVVDLESGAIADPGASSSRAARPVEEPNYIGLGIGLFVVGSLLSVVAGLGHSTSRRR
jgi:hypothetical protein